MKLIPDGYVDKVLHFSISAILMFFIFAVLLNYSNMKSPNNILVTTIGLTLFIGLVKEVFDSFNHNFDPYDIVGNILGIIFGSILLKLIICS